MHSLLREEQDREKDREQGEEEVQRGEEVRASSSSLCSTFLRPVGASVSPGSQTVLDVSDQGGLVLIRYARRLDPE